MNRKRLLLLSLIGGLVALYFFFDLGQYLSLEAMKVQQGALVAFKDANPVATAALFFVGYVVVTALSLPGATVMTLVIGGVFGLWQGLLIVSFASSIGATLAFLVARFLLRDMVQSRFGERMEAINRGIERDGAFYLFGLRLVPLFPFFVINLVMGLTPIRTWTFYWVSQLGMLAGTLVFVNAGTQLGQIDSLSGILSPGLILSFLLLGIFPLVAKRLLAMLNRRKVLAAYPKPKRFQCNLVVLGAGSGGLVAAYIAAAVRARVTLIEKDRMGGDCLNTGCVPSKALIRAARLLRDIAAASKLGIARAEAEFDFGEVMERVQRVIRQVEPHDSIARYTELGVEVIQGEARIRSPWEVEVNGQTLTTRNIIIATGGRPAIPNLPGLDQIDYLTSDNLWQIRKLPQRLLVWGGGPIGCELALCFARFGSRVTMVVRSGQLISREDPDVAGLVAARFREEGIDIRFYHDAREIRSGDDGPAMVCQHQQQEQVIPFDRLLIALGRRANVTGFGLEELGLALSDGGTIELNEFVETNFPNIHACGDVAGPHQFTHFASHQAWYATVNALFGGIKRFRADYSVIPAVTFVDPEVARVGLNEREARERGIPFESTRYELAELDRAIADGAAEGFVKVLTVPGKDRILGATIVGEHAGEMIGEFVTAMRYGLGLNKILGTIHAYPTWIEANKMTAGVWKKSRVSDRTLEWLARYHDWRRG
jgi:pyruvate/2-oxoglutarate dehydrogenase complex dihydrolipoamide dehydrogenase (E3) component/uncharacterized membrane protein YdjX (TVP38/TMEM64 family)